jgi:uncharacterized membrane-anchored protein
MKMSKWMPVLFTAAVIVQLAVPISQIVRYELTLRKGQIFKFKTAPVDPYAAFRGRYVALGFEQNQAPVSGGKKIVRGKPVYASIEVGADGFARFSSISFEPPEDKPYLKARLSHVDNTVARIELPFDRYYMEEHLAPAAEEAYRQHNLRGLQDAYATVRILNGIGVIETLFVAGKPITEFMREERGKKPPS